MAKDQNIVDAIILVVGLGLDVNVPGNCAWRIEGAPLFHGTYRTVERTRNEAARNMARILDGLPWTAAHPDGHPPLYRALAAAYEAGRRIEMFIMTHKRATT